MSGASRGFFSGVVSCGVVWPFADKTEVVAKTTASFNQGQVKGINIHGIWVSSGSRHLEAVDNIWMNILWGGSSVHQGNSLSNFSLKTEVGSFLIPSSNGGRDIIHSLDTLHESNGYPHREVGDKGGSIFDFVVLSMNDIQLELVDIFLELFSSSDVSSGEPVHGFLLDISISECFFKISLKGIESPKGLAGESLLAMNFSPCGSRPFLHVQ